MMGVAELRNLGPASARMLAEVGVHDEEALAELGAAEVYRRLRAAGVPGVTRTMLWALEGALRDVDWRELPPGVRDALLAAAERP